jgi:hypothetical protein
MIQTNEPKRIAYPNVFKIFPTAHFKINLASRTLAHLQAAQSQYTNPSLQKSQFCQPFI